MRFDVDVAGAERNSPLQDPIDDVDCLSLFHRKRFRLHVHLDLEQFGDAFLNGRLRSHYGIDAAFRDGVRLLDDIFRQGVGHGEGQLAHLIIDDLKQRDDLVLLAELQRQDPGERSVNDLEVVFRDVYEIYPDMAADGFEQQILDGKKEKTFDAMEWMAAMCSHVPNKAEQIVRYYGYYSNVSRGRRKARNEDEAVPTILDTERASREQRKN